MFMVPTRRKPRTDLALRAESRFLGDTAAFGMTDAIEGSEQFLLACAPRRAVNTVGRIDVERPM